MTFESLGDVNSTPDYALRPGSVVAYGETSWFINNSTQLWRTDGTQAGTRLVFETTQVAGGFRPYPIAGINGQLLFQSADVQHGNEIWITDDTAIGAHFVKDLTPGIFDSVVTDSIVFKNEVFLQLQVSDSTVPWPRFYRTDGTSDGTVPLFGDPSMLGQITGAYHFTFLQATNEFVFLVVHRPGIDELFRTDGTHEGTQSLGEFTHIATSTVFKDQLAFVEDQNGTNGSVWTSDGSLSGTRKIQLPGSLNLEAPFLTVAAARLIVEGNELWTTDLTPSGTVLVSGNWNSQLLRTGNYFYYFQYESNLATKLFRTDLTLTETVEIDIPSEFRSLTESRRYNSSYSYLFQMTRGTQRAIYVLDDQGLRLLDQLPSSYFEGISSDGNRFYDFHNAPGSNDVELSIVDGPTSVVSHLSRIQTGTKSSWPSTAIDGGIGLLFLAGDRPDIVQTNAPSIWYTDGTLAGTWNVEMNDRSILALGAGNAVQNGTLVYFTAEIFGVGVQLVRLDLTTRQATVVRGIVDPESFDIARLGDSVFVAPGLAPATAGAFNARSLIRVAADGTATSVIDPWHSGLQVYKVTVLNGQLYLLATTVANGLSLWRSDGTWEGTHLVQSLSSGIVFDSSLRLLAGRNRLFLTFNRSVAVAPELWTSNGTSAGTIMVHEPILINSAMVSGDHLFFMGVTSREGIELWSSDGTVSGTISITEPFSPGGDYSSISGINATDDGAIFSRNGFLYRTDGTIAGTSLLIPEQAGDNPSVEFDKVFVTASTGIYSNLLAIDAATGQSTELADENGGVVIPVYTPPQLPAMAESKTGGVVYLGDAGHLGYEPFAIAGPVTPGVPNQPHLHWTPEGSVYGFSWERVWGAVMYEVRLSDITGNVLESFTSDGRSIATISNHLPIGGYFVELRAISNDGTPTEWSVRRSFAVGLVAALSALPSDIQPAAQTLKIVSLENSTLTEVWVGDAYTNRRISLIQLPNTGSDPLAVETLLPTTAPGLYAVWVRSLLSDNSWTRWTSRQLVNVLRPAAEIISFVPVESTRRINLSWQTVPSATGYEIEVYSTSNGSIDRLVLRAWPRSVNDASFSVQPDQYSVRIRALKGEYLLSAWSAFGVTLLKAAPQLKKTASEIAWYPVAGASGYRIQIANSKTGAVITDQLVSPQTLSTGSLPFGPLTVNVSSVYNQPVSDERTSTTSIEIFRPIVTPGFQYAITSDATPIATWTAATGAASYEIQVLTTSGVLQYKKTGLTSTSQRIDSKLSNGDYRVWLRSWYADGSRSAWGQGTTLRIGVPVSVTRSSNILNWGTANQATHYELWINYNGPIQPKPAKIVHELFLVNTSFALPQSLPKGKYSVWVRPVRAEASDLYLGQWSSVLNFDL